MKAPFEIEWMGGAAEHHFRKARPGIEELPWGTLDVSDYPPEVALAARASWTESAYTEYKAVAAFSEVLSRLCEAQAPLDLIGMASSFVADEVVHVELCSRVAMELGGGVEKPVDFEALAVKPDPTRTPFERANEVVLRVSCIAEAFSSRMAVNAMRGATHPLTRAVYERIVADESLHYRLGGVYMEWASERMSDAERARLGKVALRALEGFAPMWRSPGARAHAPGQAAGKPSRPDAYAAGRRSATVEQVHELGWIETRVFKDQARDAVREVVIAPLMKYGIALPSEGVEALLA
jgi:hypothetical protein